MKKLFLFLLLGVFLISFTSASIDHLGTFQFNSCVDLVQICADCTYNNVTKILLPNSSSALSSEASMTRLDTFYNYTFCNTTVLGRYVVNGHGDLEGTKTTWNYDFNITPSGDSDTLGLFIFITLIAYGIGFFGFFGRHEWVSVLGGFAMLSLGIYFVSQGIIIYRDWLTTGVATITLGLGAFFSIAPVVEMIQDTL